MGTEGQDSNVLVSQPILSLRGICKYFGGVHALEDVDFDVYPQEVVALVGDNGAGKSTLIKIIAGVHQPTRGEIFFFNRPVQIRSPRDAQMLGIETVYQELALVETRDVPANFSLAGNPRKTGWVSSSTGKRWWTIPFEPSESLVSSFPLLELRCGTSQGGKDRPWL